jgi:hypothetical protein
MSPHRRGPGTPAQHRAQHGRSQGARRRAPRSLFRREPEEGWGQAAQRGFEALLGFRGKVPNDRGDGRWDVQPEGPHRRRRFFTGASGSPNMSSNESPLLPVA